MFVWGVCVKLSEVLTAVSIHEKLMFKVMQKLICMKLEGLLGKCFPLVIRSQAAITDLNPWSG